MTSGTTRAFFLLRGVGYAILIAIVLLSSTGCNPVVFVNTPPSEYLDSSDVLVGSIKDRLQPGSVVLSNPDAEGVRTYTSFRPPSKNSTDPPTRSVQTVRFRLYLIEGNYFAFAEESKVEANSLRSPGHHLIRLHAVGKAIVPQLLEKDGLQVPAGLTASDLASATPAALVGILSNVDWLSKAFQVPSKEDTYRSQTLQYSLRLPGEASSKTVWAVALISSVITAVLVIAAASEGLSSSTPNAANEFVQGAAIWGGIIAFGMIVVYSVFGFTWELWGLSEIIRIVVPSILFPTFCAWLVCQNQDSISLFCRSVRFENMKKAVPAVLTAMALITPGLFVVHRIEAAVLRWFEERDYAVTAITPELSGTRPAIRQPTFWDGPFDWWFGIPQVESVEWSVASQQYTLALPSTWKTSLFSGVRLILQVLNVLFLLALARVVISILLRIAAAQSPEPIVYRPA